MNEQKNRKFGAAISVANMAVSLVIGLLYTPFVLRLLGKCEYGVYTLALSLIAYLTMLDMGFGNTLVRYSARARAEGKEEKNIYGMFFLLYMGIALIALIIGIIIMLNIESFFQKSFTPHEAKTLKLIFEILLINTVIAFPGSVFSSIIRSKQQFIFANSLTLFMNVAKHAVTLAFLFSGFKSVTMALVTLFVTVTTIIVNIYFCFGKLKIKIGFKRFSRDYYKEVFIYSFFILLNIVVDQLYAGTDKVILGKVCNSAAVAVYGVGVTFQTYFTEFSTSISGVFLPHVSALSTKETAIRDMSALFTKVGRIQFALLSFILCGFAAFGKEFIALWAGDGYGDAYWIALLVMVPAVIPLSQNIGISVLQALNKHRYRSVMYLCIAVLNVLISIPLAELFEGLGAAMGTCIATICGQILFMNIVVYKRLIKLDIGAYWRQSIWILVKMIPIRIIFALSNFFMAGDTWKALILKIGVSLVIVAPYAAFALLKKEERQAILKKLRLAK